LPETDATEEMLQRAWAGEYKPVFSTQSQIGHHARELQKSILPADRLKSVRGHELKANILEDMGNQLRAQGYHEAADLLKGGISDFRKHKKIREALSSITPILKKIGYPTTALALLGVGYGAAKRGT
jgi:hypothetical protein